MNEFEETKKVSTLRKMWTRLRWPLLLSGICGGAGLALSLGMQGVGGG